MKNTSILFTLLFLTNFGYCQDKLQNWHKITAFNSTVSFSRTAEPGRISVFLISTWWCPPCKVLKQQLIKMAPKLPRVDFYYVAMASDSSGEKTIRDTQNTIIYRQWLFYNKLEAWPTIFITAPNTNVYSRFSSQSLKKEESNINIYEKTIHVISELIQLENKYELKKEKYFLSKEQ